MAGDFDCYLEVLDSIPITLGIHKTDTKTTQTQDSEQLYVDQTNHFFKTKFYSLYLSPELLLRMHYHSFIHLLIKIDSVV